MMNEGSNSKMVFESYEALIQHSETLLKNKAPGLDEFQLALNQHIAFYFDEEEYSDNDLFLETLDVEDDVEDFEAKYSLDHDEYEDKNEVINNIDNARQDCLRCIASTELNIPQKLAIIDHFNKFKKDALRYKDLFKDTSELDAVIKGKPSSDVKIVLVGTMIKTEADKPKTVFNNLDTLIQTHDSLLFNEGPAETQKLNQAIRDNLFFDEVPTVQLKKRLYEQLKALEETVDENREEEISPEEIEKIKRLYLNVMSADRTIRVPIPLIGSAIGKQIVSLQNTATGEKKLHMDEQIELAERFLTVMRHFPQITPADDEEKKNQQITLQNYKLPEKAGLPDPYEFKPLTAEERKKYDASLTFNENIPWWHQQDEIIPNLILGRIPKPNDVDDLIARGVKLIVTVLMPGELAVVTFDVEKLRQHGIEHIIIHAEDFKGGNSDPKLFAGALAPIHKKLLDNELVYVDCKAGKARSGALLETILHTFGPHDKSGAYQVYQDYMRKKLKTDDLTQIPKWKLLEVTISFLKSKRSQVSISLGKRQRALQAIAYFKDTLQDKVFPTFNTPAEYLASEEGKYAIRQDLHSFKALGLYAIKLQEKNPASPEAKAINDFFQFIKNYDVKQDYQKTWKDFEDKIITFNDTKLTELVSRFKEDFNNKINGKPLKVEAKPFNLIQLAGGKGKASTVATAEINKAISTINPKMREYLKDPANYEKRDELTQEVNALITMMLQKIEGKKDKILKESEIIDVTLLFKNLQEMIEALNSVNKFLNKESTSGKKLTELAEYFSNITYDKYSAGQKFRFSHLKKQAENIFKHDETNIKSPILGKAIEEKLKSVTPAPVLPIKQVNNLFAANISIDEVQHKYNDFLKVVLPISQLNSLGSAFKAAIEPNVSMPAMEYEKIKNEDGLIKVNNHLKKLDAYLTYLKEVEVYLKAQNLSTKDLDVKIKQTETKIQQWVTKQKNLQEKIEGLKNAAEHKLQEFQQKKMETESKTTTLTISGKSQTKPIDEIKKETYETLIYTGIGLKEVSTEEEITGPYVKRYADKHVVYPMPGADSTPVNKECIRKAMEDFIKTHEKGVTDKSKIKLSGNPELIKVAEKIRDEVWTAHLNAKNETPKVGVSIEPIDESSQLSSENKA